MKYTPARSYTSRSCQSAVLQMWATDGNSGNWPGWSSFHAGSDHLQHQAVFVLHAEQVIDHLEMRLPVGLGGFLFVGVQVVDSRDAVEVVESQTRLVSQMLADFEQPFWSHFDPGIDVLEVGAGDLVAELLFSCRQKIVRSWGRGSGVQED